MDSHDFYFWGYFDGSSYQYAGSGDFHDMEGNPLINSSITLGGGELKFLSIQDKSWGVWQGLLGGVYDGDTSGNWSLNFQDRIISYIGEPVNMLANFGISGTWAANKIEGDILGSWADLDEVIPMTGISAGELIGTFDPASPTEMTWQASAIGAWVSTSKFLEMSESAQGRQTLEALNIPCIQVGSTDLAGYGGDIASVQMNDVRFFAYSSGAAPRIWATGDILGTIINGSDPVGDTAHLSGPGFEDVGFKIEKYDVSGGKWGASIDSASGSIAGYPIAIKGNAAGTVDSSTQFSGSGSGLANARQDIMQ